MATFLIERYWPGVTADAAEAATTAIAEVGTDTSVLETILAPGDEVCFWYVEAASVASVAAVFGAAAVPLDRISEAARLPAPSSARVASSSPTVRP